jgi:hypothetical protein
MNHKAIYFLFVAAILAAIATAGFGYQEYELLKESRAQLIALELQPMATLLTENQSLIKELQAEPFGEKDAGILDSYLAQLRRDGIARHADMKQRLDALAENNAAIVTLIKAYAPRAKTALFTANSEKFRNYASAWRDRWNSVMELFMAGGNYAVTEVALPNEFEQALQAEIAAALLQA